MADRNIMNAIARLNSIVKKLDKADLNKLNLSPRVLENRILTLEGYLSYLDQVGIPKIEEYLKVSTENSEVLVGGEND
ncbi:MAG: hypothetical protein KAX49_19515 [Halanaerobiales bacterium]|nr:hypothetical protein [Halanaerobiales bacterium]